MISATAGIHWLTSGTTAPLEHVEDVFGGLGQAEKPGGFGHPYRRVHESGAVIYCGSSRADQPIVINAPGEVCETWAEPLLAYSVELNAWVTRGDFALDVEPAALARQRMFEMRDAFWGGRCETKMRQGRRSTSFSEDRSYGEGEGFTFYFGGRTADLRLRVYDRRGPLRIETQWRPSREVGQVLPEMILKHGAAHWWRSTARQLKFPMPWYRELLGGAAQVVPQLPDVAAAFDQALTEFRQQWGQSLWAFRIMGMTLESLEKVPDALRGSQVAKLTAWGQAGKKLGYDGDALIAEARRLGRRRGRESE